MNAPQISVNELLRQLDLHNKTDCEKKYVSASSLKKGTLTAPAVEQSQEETQEKKPQIILPFDCLKRSIYELITIISQIQEQGICLCSVCESSIDTRTASRELLFKIAIALSRLEQKFITEQHFVNSPETKKEGSRKCGRKPTSPDEQKVQLVKQLSNNQSISISQICETLKISRATYYRYLNLINFYEQDKTSSISSKNDGIKYNQQKQAIH